MNRHARRQREEQPVLQLSSEQQEILERYRTEFEDKKAAARQSRVQLDLAALEVEAQRKAAFAEKEGLSFHEGYQKAVKAYNRLQ